MNLKAFHVVFITACTVLSLTVAVWCVQQWRHDGGSSLLLGAAASVAGGVALAVYGSWSLKKMGRLP